MLFVETALAHCAAEIYEAYQQRTDCCCFFNKKQLLFGIGHNFIYF